MIIDDKLLLNFETKFELKFILSHVKLQNFWLEIQKLRVHPILMILRASMPLCVWICPPKKHTNLLQKKKIIKVWTITIVMCRCSDELHFFCIGENCKDTHNLCNQWAADNLCDKGNDTIDSQSVQRVCPKSCKICFWRLLNLSEVRLLCGYCLLLVRGPRYIFFTNTFFERFIIR